MAIFLWILSAIGLLLTVNVAMNTQSAMHEIYYGTMVCATAILFVGGAICAKLDELIDSQNIEIGGS